MAAAPPCNGTMARMPAFPAAKPWLPVHPDYTHRNVAAQQADPDQLFNFTKKLLSLRKAHPALLHGDFVPLQAGPGILSYLRTTPEQTVLVAINFKGRAREISPLPRENGKHFSPARQIQLKQPQALNLTKCACSLESRD